MHVIPKSAHPRQFGPQHVLYRFYSRNGRLLYIGITGNPDQRFRDHRRDQPWWVEVDYIKLERYSTRGELAQAEINAIRGEKPKYNVTHAEETPLDPVGVSHRRGIQTLWPDASNFGTSYEDKGIRDRIPKLFKSDPCPDCWSRNVYKDCAADRKPTDDLVRCPDCMNMWLDEEWREMFPICDLTDRHDTYILTRE